AIELAAARGRVLPPQARLPRPDQSLSLLSGSRRDLPERHQTLRSAIGWSLDLLRPEEQAFFRRLGVFAGDFSEEAAEAMTKDTGLAALEGLTSLVEKSLLELRELRGDARFHLLETGREAARERLAEAGEERTARLRHAEWVDRFFAREHQELLRSGRRQVAHEHIAAEMAGARMALRFAAGPGG